MRIELSPSEARIIGCLIEKEITTPEQYPLSLNALTNACNQKSNRDPVLELDESAVRRTLDGLIARYLVSEESGYGARVAKFRHRFCNSEYGRLKFSPAELAILCELLLRGAQTPGELRSRASRLCPFRDVGEVETTLDTLARREDGPFVERLPREPGRRESRYRHLFDSDATAGEVAPQGEAEVATSDPLAAVTARVAQLEAHVAGLQAEVAALRARLHATTFTS